MTFRIALLVAAGLLAATPAAAADGASFNVIGYSPDARQFAFEQYGVQDGSGFPYWDIFVLDLERDAWSMGSPVRVLVEDETAGLSVARDKARAQADAALKRARVTEPAVTLAANFATEVAGDRSSLTFSRWYVPMGVAPEVPTGSYEIRHRLSVEPVPLPAPEGCTPEDGPYVGLRLTLEDLKLSTSHSFYEDKALPASRRCPTAYEVTAVVAPSGLPDTDRLVAIIGVYSRGFEGADQRFIAIPFTLSD